MQPTYLALRGKFDRLRDTWAPITHTSTFRETGQITPEEFVQAGDYLVYKFPSWSWSSASSPAKQVAYLPPNKQYLVTRGVPSHRRLDANFAGGEEKVVKGGEGFDDEDGDGEGWLSTGGEETRAEANVGDVRSLGEKGEVDEAVEEDEEEIPDMEDEDDDEDAIIREPEGAKDNAPHRTYNLYIVYSTYYRTPRLYLSGYASASTPLSPAQMLEDIVGDYKDKTVTLEDFPFFDSPLKTASVHPCKHASVMKVLLDRADAALKIRKAKLRRAQEAAADSGMKGLAEETGRLGIADRGKGTSVPGEGSAGNNREGGDGWEVLQHEAEEDDEVAIRVDQYVVVFLKFMASVTPGIEHDFTMGV